MGTGVRSVEAHGFADLSPAGFYLAVRVGFAFPELEHNALPLAWVHRYTHDGLMMYDPVIRWMYENAGRVRWSEIEIDDPRDVLGMAADHGLLHGAAVCVLDKTNPGLRTFGSFAREDREFDDDELAVLEIKVAELHAENSPPDDLTRGELEALDLVRDGLLMKEIAHRLGVTESAVKQRLRNAKTKLHARTTAQAVTQATQFGLIGRA